MIIDKIAKRYAKSFFRLGIEQNHLDEFYNDLQMVSHFISISSDFSNLLNRGYIKSEDKTLIFKDLFENKINTITLKFLQLLIEKKREEKLKNIIYYFNFLYKNQNNIIPIKITTAKEMKQEMEDKIIGIVSKIFPNKTFEIKKEINPDLIGGFIIQTDDKQIDASVKTRLYKIKKQLIIN